MSIFLNVSKCSILPFDRRNGLPPLRILRRWLGKEPLQIPIKHNDSISRLEQQEAQHEKAMKSLRQRLEEKRREYEESIQ